MRQCHSKKLMSRDTLWKILSYHLVNLPSALLIKLDQQNPLQLPLAWILFLYIEVDCNACQCKSISSYHIIWSLKKGCQRNASCIWYMA